MYLFCGETTSLVKGDWNSRINSFVKLFGNCPDSLRNNVGELESIRSLRNSIGHSFGRILSTEDQLTITNYHPMDRLSESRLKKWLGLVFAIAHDIDEYFLTEHIGAYELIRYYHYWFIKEDHHYAKNSHPNEILKNKIKKFCKYFYDDLVSDWGGSPPLRPYLEGLIKYYAI